MHKGFIDKNRRLFNLRQMQVGNVLPEHFAQYYPKFISLLEKYYEWQEQNDSTELLNHLFAVRDINETDITLLSYIEDELLLGDAYFEGFGQTEVEKRAAANFSNTLFRSKGTKFAIEWFFRSFYGLDAEVVYPKENVFKIGDTNSALGPDSLRYLTDDKLYQTYSLLVRVGIPISKWNDVFKLFAHPAGMYLGGEVLLTSLGNIVVSTPVEDSSVSTRSLTSYSLTVDVDSATEGTVHTFTATGTNVLNGIDALYYYIDHLSTADSDFIGAVPSSTNPRYVPVSNSIGSFTVQTRLDSDDTEGLESFKVYVQDQYGTKYDSATINVTDVASTYTLTTASSTVQEGSEIVFTLTGTNAPAYNSTLYYYVTHGTTSDADFLTTPPSSGSPQAVSIVDGTGSFSLTTVASDNPAETDETFSVSVKTLGGIVKATQALTLENVVRTLNVTVANITEGNDVVANITVDASSIGKTVSWNITGTLASDGRLSSTSGTFVISSLSQNYTLTSVSASDTYQGSVSGTVTITVDPSLSDNDTFSVTDAAPTYVLTADPSSATEGDTVDFDLTGTNIQNGTYYFAITHGTTNDADFSVTPPTSTRQAITVTGNASSPSPSLTFASNSDLTNETFTAEIYAASTGGSPLVSIPYTITGTAVSYNLSASASTYNEGDTVAVNLTGSGFADGTYYYWVEATGGSSITSADFVNGANFTGSNRETFSVSSSFGVFAFDIASDLQVEGSETFVIKVSDSISGGALATTSTITISDTSTPTYTITADNIVEGNEFLVEVDAAISGSETVYLEVTGSAASKLSTTQKSVNVTSGVPFNVSFGNSTVNSLYEGGVTGTVSLYRGSYGGTLLATDTFTITDAAASFTLTANDTTPNEGSTIGFTVSGSNIQNGNYYYYIKDDIIPTNVSATASAGTTFIPMSSTTGLTIGMETNSIGIPGVITNVSGSGVTMSSLLTATISSGTTLYFALPAVFDDFTNSPTGIVSVSSNSGSFNVTVSTNTDTSNDAYTFALYDASYNGTELASEDIVIQDQTTGIVDIDVAGLDTVLGNPAVVDISYNVAANSTIQFLTNGNIVASGSESPGGDGIVVGSWVTGSFNPSDYTVIGTITSQSGGSTIGSFGTTLTIDETRTFGLFQGPPAVNGLSSGSMTVEFTITGPGTGNQDTQAIYFDVEANTYTAGGGGFIER